MVPAPTAALLSHLHLNCARCRSQFCTECSEHYVSYYERCKLICTNTLLQPCVCQQYSKNLTVLFSCSKNCFEVVESFVRRPFANSKQNILRTVACMINNNAIKDCEHSFEKIDTENPETYSDTVVESSLPHLELIANEELLSSSSESEAETE